MKTYKDNEELFCLDEDDLIKELAKKRKPPTPKTNILRLKLWWEYEQALLEDRDINIKVVCQGVCTVDGFKLWILSNKYMSAWLFMPPRDYGVKIEEMLDWGFDRMRAILDLDPVTRNEEGDVVKINTQLVNAQFHILKHFDERRNGLATQKSINLTRLVGDDKKDLLDIMETSSDDDLLKRLSKAKSEELKALHAPLVEMDVRDVSKSGDDDGPY